MIALWKAEYQKTRGRYLLLFILGMTAVELVWMLHGNLNEDARQKGWMMLLFQMPLMNALVIPITAMMISSRLGDLEHKNGMLKQLCCVAERGKLYDVKLLYGLLLMLISVLLVWCGVIFDGFFRDHFGGAFPMKDYLLLLLFTILPTVAVYMLLHAVAMCCEKPAVPYALGIIGDFLGMLSMFLPQYPWLRNSLIWGYYAVLMFVGSEYDRATRISTYYYMDISWGGFVRLLVMIAVIYAVGKNIFCKKEI